MKYWYWIAGLVVLIGVAYGSYYLATSNNKGGDTKDQAQDRGLDLGLPTTPDTTSLKDIPVDKTGKEIELATYTKAEFGFAFDYPTRDGYGKFEEWTNLLGPSANSAVFSVSMYSSKISGSGIPGGFLNTIGAIYYRKNLADTMAQIKADIQTDTIQFSSSKKNQRGLSYVTFERNSDGYKMSGAVVALTNDTSLELTADYDAKYQTTVMDTFNTVLGSARTVKISGVNHPPKILNKIDPAQPDSVATYPGWTFQFKADVFDLDGDPITYKWYLGPAGDPTSPNVKLVATTTSPYYTLNVGTGHILSGVEEDTAGGSGPIYQLRVVTEDGRGGSDNRRWDFLVFSQADYQRCAAGTAHCFDFVIVQQ